MPHNSSIGGYSNSYAIHIVGHHHGYYGYYIAGTPHLFELPEGAVEQEMKENGNVFGCGLIVDPDNKLVIFFTLNGQLLGKLMLQILRINNKRISCIYIFPTN
jgi:hypothetical protein